MRSKMRNAANGDRERIRPRRLVGRFSLNRGRRRDVLLDAPSLRGHPLSSDWTQVGQGRQRVVLRGILGQPSDPKDGREEGDSCVPR
jgi:hypothetical protein